MPSMVTEFMRTGVFGQSSLVGTCEILTIMSKEAWSTQAPKTGCLDSPGLNQSDESASEGRACAGTRGGTQDARKGGRGEGGER